MERGLVHISVVLRDAFEAILKDAEINQKAPDGPEIPQETQEPESED